MAVHPCTAREGPSQKTYWIYGDLLQIPNRCRPTRQMCRLLCRGQRDVVWKPVPVSDLLTPDGIAIVRRLAQGEVVPKAGLACANEVAAWLEPRSLRGSAAAEFRLERQLELLDAAVVKAQLAASTLNSLASLEVLWSATSTNTRLLDAFERKDMRGVVITAEEQTAGKGRRGRTWVSPFGRNLYVSLGWTLPRQGPALDGLSLVVGMAIASSLRDMGVRDVGLKWPNDVLLGGGKLAGILIEIGALSDVVPIVVGFGVNLAMSDSEASRIDQKWSALGEVLDMSRNRLLGRLLDQVFNRLIRFEGSGFGPFRDEWDGFDLYRGERVVIKLGDRSIEGVNCGVDDHGNLQLRADDGEVRSYNAGEVSLRLQI